MFLGQLCRSNPILSLDHNLTKIRNSAWIKSPGEIQGITSIVENNVALLSVDFIVAQIDKTSPK